MLKKIKKIISANKVIVWFNTTGIQINDAVLTKNTFLICGNGCPILRKHY